MLIAFKYCAICLRNIYRRPGITSPLFSCIRHLACIALLSKLTCHTELTLSYLQGHVRDFGQTAEARKIMPSQPVSLLDELPQRLSAKVDFVSFKFPKMHSLSHLVDIIRRKGPTDGYHTGIGESLHPQTKKDYKRTNSHPGFELQVRNYRLIRRWKPLHQHCPR